MTSAELCDRAGVTYRQLDYWIRVGYVAPSRSRGTPGSGNPRRWSDADVLRVIEIRETIDRCIDLLRAARLAVPGGWQRGKRITRL